MKPIRYTSAATAAAEYASFVKGVTPGIVLASCVVSSAAEVWRARCEAVGVVLHAQLPPHELVTVTDPTRVRQIVDGLAENALRVTPAGAPIVLALYPQRGYAAVQVRDGGPGLTPDDCAVAFDRYTKHGTWRRIATVRTGADGRARLSLRESTKPLEFRASWNGATDLAAASSRPVVVKAVPRSH